MNYSISKNLYESDYCFDKRRGYLQQYVIPRMEEYDSACVGKRPYSQPISKDHEAEIRAYWRGILNSHTDLLNMEYFGFYNAVEPDKNRLKYYIPDGFFYGFIDEWLTHPKRSTSVDDKQLYPYLFHGHKTTEVIARKVGDNFFNAEFKPISFAEFSQICKEEGEVVAKASISSYGGHGVRFFDMSKNTPEQLLAYLSKPSYFYTMPYGTEYVIERVVKQHETLKSFNPSSINTIRIMTMIYEGECIALSSVLRMGVNGSRVDNCSSGGIVAGITETGVVKDVAYTANGQKFYTHPQTGKFGGKVIPGFQSAIEMVKELHWRFSGISQLISWDIAINEVGEPVLIEMNISYGELDFHQYCNGPIFGELTDEILKKFKYKSYTYNGYIGNIGIM